MTEQIKHIDEVLRAKLYTAYAGGAAVVDVIKELNVHRNLAYRMYRAYLKKSKEQFKDTSQVDIKALSYKVELYTKFTEIPNIEKWINNYNTALPKIKIIRNVREKTKTGI